MFKFFSLFIVTCTLVLVGCEASTTPETVTTNEDDIARYEAMIEADQEATEADTADDDSQ